MRRSPFFLFALLALVGGFIVSSCSRTERPAELVLTNGSIYTMDGGRSWAESLAIGEGRILYVGSQAGLSEWIGPETRRMDLQGRMVLPGFHDAHVHLVSGGRALGLCHVADLESVEEILEAVGKYSDENPDRPWIEGSGWDLPLFPDAHPRKELLDAVVFDRPVYLRAADGHSAWVNSRALEVAGLDARTPDPPGGRIERDPLTGEPTGTLREEAMDLVHRHIPEPSLEELVDGLRRAVERANRFGITSVQEANASEAHLEAYLRLAQEGDLTLRVVAAQEVDLAEGVEQIPRLIEKRDRFRSDRLRASAAKIFVDGVIESRTAALLEPYLGRADDRRGDLTLSAAQLDRLVTALAAAGFQVHLHAIGDRAVRSALDACGRALEGNGNRDLRHHIAHLQLIDPQDIPRFRSLGVVANFQPLWAYADRYITELTEPFLGPARSRWLYPLFSVFQTGALIVAGSDWPVSSMNPLEAIQVGATRSDRRDPQASAWIPEERMPLPAMLWAYTSAGAFVNHQERDTGSLEAGKWADLIVLDRNIFEVDERQIHTVRVLATMLAGEVVYRDPIF